MAASRTPVTGSRQFPISKVKERYHRQIVSYRTREKPGTIIVVDTRSR
jgi:lipoprotein-anchoring transpeptidase ErfK/SrfK